MRRDLMGVAQHFSQVISFLEPEEAVRLDLATEDSVSFEIGLAFRTFPIEDRHPPANADAFRDLVTEVVTRLQEGISVGVHCKSGIGRSGLAAAAVLIMARRLSATEALNQVRIARGKLAPNTARQRRWLLRHASSFMR